MAFANSVLMRSGKSWAWAPDDGSMLYGTATSVLEGRRWLRRPVLRSVVSFIAMTALSMRLHRLNDARRTTRLLLCLPLGNSAVGQALSLVVAVLVIAVALELFRLIERSPRSPLSRVVLFGGRTLQRVLTTREPRSEHLDLTRRALIGDIEAESVSSQ